MQYDGVTLPYPVGIADIQEISGAAFNASDFQTKPMFIYIGDSDNNDAVPYSDGSDNKHAEAQIHGRRKSG
jgi:hypothetical protein